MVGGIQICECSITTSYAGLIFLVEEKEDISKMLGPIARELWGAERTGSMVGMGGLEKSIKGNKTRKARNFIKKARE